MAFIACCCSQCERCAFLLRAAKRRAGEGSRGSRESARALSVQATAETGSLRVRLVLAAAKGSDA